MSDSASVIEYANGEDFAGWADSANPGSHLFLICKNGEEHRGEIALRKAGLEIRDCIRWFHQRTHLSVVIGRKPLEGTVAQNVLKYGTGGINIDAGRVIGAPRTTHRDGNWTGAKDKLGIDCNSYGGGLRKAKTEVPSGRWPANVMHDGGSVVELFPANRPSSGGKAFTGWNTYGYSKTSPTGSIEPQASIEIGYGDSGSAARFFHAAESLDALKQYLHKLITQERSDDE